MTTSTKQIELPINMPNYDQHLLVCEVELTISEFDSGIEHVFRLVRPVSGQIETGSSETQCSFRDADNVEVDWLFSIAKRQYDLSTNDGFDAIASAWDMVTACP